MNFNLLFCKDETPGTDLTAHVKIAPFPFNLIRIRNDVAVPLAHKMRRKLDLEVELNVAAKKRAGLFGAKVRGEHEFSHKRKMIGSNPRER